MKLSVEISVSIPGLAMGLEGSIIGLGGKLSLGTTEVEADRSFICMSSLITKLFTRDSVIPIATVSSHLIACGSQLCMSPQDER